MTSADDPIRRLPRPAHVHAHIGRLLRELRLARRLLKLSKAAVPDANRTSHGDRVETSTLRNRA